MHRRLATILAALALPAAALAQSGDTPAPGDWPRYARDLSGDRYSPLTQIDTKNVKRLQAAWSFRLRPEGGAAVLGGTVPIVIDDVMYMPIGNAVVALEADSGKELWRHPVKGLVRAGWPPGGAQDARAQRRWLAALEQVLLTQTERHGGPIAFVEGKGPNLDARPPPPPPTPPHQAPPRPHQAAARSWSGTPRCA